MKSVIWRTRVKILSMVAKVWSELFFETLKEFFWEGEFFFEIVKFLGNLSIIELTFFTSKLPQF